MRYFNKTGPCVPELHYMLPPEPRLPGARPLIDRGLYFVVHAPRQTGKTTTLSALARTLTAEGRFAALHFSCETGEAAGDDYGAAEEKVLDEIRAGAELAELPPELCPPAPWPDAPNGVRLKTGLTAWARLCPRPLVLFFDEIDSLRGQSLISVLRQLRAGYPSRPRAFPASIVLCGLRDVRDYKAASGGDPGKLGGPSPFNILEKSLRVGDFTDEELRALYAQHTEETGQPFTGEALDRVFDHTRGQPWLVNALASEIIYEMGVAPPTPITTDHVDEAKERLILARVTHLDSLAARLNESRVRRVIGPIIAGEHIQLNPYDDDLGYLRDLGILAPSNPATVANPIYREVIVRVLGTEAEANIVIDDPRSFVAPEGRLDFGKLLEEFAAFWRLHGEVLTSGAAYHEVAPQLVIMAYLRRVVNGGGYIDREYGVASGRIDLLVRWPYGRDGDKRSLQREAIELKVRRPRQADPLPDGLQQLDKYLDGLGLDHGTLVIFDRRDQAPPITERTRFADERTPSGRTVTLLRA